MVGGLFVSHRKEAPKMPKVLIADSSEVSIARRVRLALDALLNLLADEVVFDLQALGTSARGQVVSRRLKRGKPARRKNKAK
jgi:hypothetical protein